MGCCEPTLYRTTTLSVAKDSLLTDKSDILLILEGNFWHEESIHLDTPKLPEDYSFRPSPDPLLVESFRTLQLPKTLANLLTSYSEIPGTPISDLNLGQKDGRIDSFIHIQSDDLDQSLKDLYSLVKSQDKGIKISLVDCRIFDQLIPMMSHSSRRIRILVSTICACIYNEYDTAQLEFLSKRGGFSLIQLMKRDGDSDAIFILLLEHIIDLVFVCST